MKQTYIIIAVIGAVLIVTILGVLMYSQIGEDPRSAQVEEFFIDQENYQLLYHLSTKETETGTTTAIESYRIKQDGKKVQTIPVDVQTVMPPSPEETVLSDWDVNFDGIRDVALLQGVGYNGVNYVYDVYYFDQANSQLVLHPVLQGISNPVLDEGGTVLSSSARSGPVWCAYQYDYLDGAWSGPQLIDNTSEQGNPDISLQDYCSI